MKPQTLTGFERYGKTTRRAQFLADMQVIVPWAELTAAVEPFYPKISEAGGRPPIAVGADAAGVLFAAVVQSVGPGGRGSVVRVELDVEAAPDETSVCKFRHLLENISWERSC